MTVWLIAALGGCIGVAAGLLGAGASILTVLLLVHVAGLELGSAVTTSLAVVAVTSLIALVPYARTGAVVWRAGIGFALASMTGAYLGGRVSAFIPERVLQVIFLMAMIGAAIAMLWKRPLPSPDGCPRTPKQSVPAVAGAGLLLGGLTGMVGLGGGFAVLPLLVVYLGTPVRSAVGTSLFVVAMNTLAGLAGHLPHLGIDWRLAAWVGITASAGSLAGARLGQRIEGDVLRPAFAALMLVTAAALLGSAIAR